ncbi:hypothetical protein ALCH109712_16975 [Alkalicoccus chagannorensis]|uniref:hypothetical protein n=1 Tax=Alkalicoccus chagannorensis TaxID=427072 RepID=UPI0039EF44B2
MTEKEREPVRINVKISADSNDWLEAESRKSALTKSALVNVAIREYIKQSTTVDNMPEMMKMMSQLQEYVDPEKQHKINE